MHRDCKPLCAQALARVGAAAARPRACAGVCAPNRYSQPGRKPGSAAAQPPKRCSVGRGVKGGKGRHLQAVHGRHALRVLAQHAGDVGLHALHGVACARQDCHASAPAPQNCIASMQASPKGACISSHSNPTRPAAPHAVQAPQRQRSRACATGSVGHSQAHIDRSHLARRAPSCPDESCASRRGARRPRVIHHRGRPGIPKAGWGPARAAMRAWVLGQRADGGGRRQRRALLQRGQAQARAHEQRVVLLRHVHAGHHDAVHERGRRVRDLLAHAQHGRVVQHERDEVLALLQVAARVGVQHLRGRSPLPPPQNSQRRAGAGCAC